MLETDLLTAESEAGALETDVLVAVVPTAVLETSSLMVRASARRRRAGVSRRGRRAALRAGALCQPEAGSDFEAEFSYILHESQSRCIARTSQNSQTHNSHSTIARSLHAVHGARCVQNSLNSLGDGVVRGRGVCAPGETKSLSTSTQTGVRLCMSPLIQSRTPLKLHVETWEGLLRNQGPKIFREVEIAPGCAVRVACPSCPDYSPEPPGPGRTIRNMLGWSQLEKTERSGEWCFGVPSKGRIFFLPLTQQETGKGRGRTTQRGRSPVPASAANCL